MCAAVEKTSISIFSLVISKLDFSFCCAFIILPCSRFFTLNLCFGFLLCFSFLSHLLSRVVVVYVACNLRDLGFLCMLSADRGAVRCWCKSQS